jgi:hypothetical protein
LAAALALATGAAYARSGENGVNGGHMIAAYARPNPQCQLESVVSRDGWAQVRRQPNLDGTPLRRVTNGSTLAWCGAVRRDSNGRPWHFIRFVTGTESWQHSGGVAAGPLTAVPQETTPELEPAQIPPAPLAPQQAPQPPTVVTPPSTTNTIEGEPPFDAKACIVTPTISHAYPVYESEDVNSQVVGDLQPGDSVCVLATGEWTHVHFKRGKTFEGWVHGLEIQSTAQPY